MKRGVSIHWQLNEQIEELAQKNNVKWNRMIVVLLELGLPVFTKVDGRAPALANALLQSRRYHYVKRRRGSDKIIQAIQDKEGKRIKLDDRISAGLPKQKKEAIRKEADRRKMYMSQVIREQLGLSY